MSSNWDVIVVGAGPGGTTAAGDLAAAGYRVLLLEKEKLPRYKPCGGGLTAKVRHTLDFDFSPAIEDTADVVSIAYGAQRTRLRSRVWCVMRPKFDALLAEHAIQQGAVLRDGQAVTLIALDDKGATVTTRQETLSARYIVGADGANGIVRRAMGLGPHARVGVALEAEMEVSSAALDEWRGVLHMDFAALDRGYAWIFPKAEHLSIGIGVLLRSTRATDLRAALARYVKSEPSLEGAQARIVRGHRLPLGGDFSRRHASHAVVVGDAAGLVDPFTGEGIYYALRSGHIAAQEIARAMQDERANLSAFSRRINREINLDFWYARALANLFYNLPYVGYQIFNACPLARESVLQAIDGVLSYRQLLLRIVSGLVLVAPSRA